MIPGLDRATIWLLVGVLGVLLLATLIGQALRLSLKGASGSTVVANLNARIRAWWVMCAVLAVTLLAGRVVSVLLFGVTSLLALREFIALTPALQQDKRTLLWAFFILTPVQYLLVGLGRYDLFSIFIPVIAFLLIPVRNVLTGNYTNFLGRTAGVQWGLMICVYCVSYAPALLTLHTEGSGALNAKLLIFLIIVVQGSDVLQYIWGKLLGRHKIVPAISPNKTWEGFVGGVLCATALGTLLWWATPFQPWQAAIIALTIALAGFVGGLTMSALKRDQGVKDFGTLIEGHGGVLDRIDSLCFAAPIFFQIARVFFT